MIWHLKLLQERFDLGRSDVLQELLHVYSLATPHDPPGAPKPDFGHQAAAVLPGTMLIFLALDLSRALGRADRCLVHDLRSYLTRRY
jgi:hypothetical protein